MNFIDEFVMLLLFSVTCSLVWVVLYGLINCNQNKTRDGGKTNQPKRCEKCFYQHQRLVSAVVDMKNNEADLKNELTDLKNLVEELRKKLMKSEMEKTQMSRGGFHMTPPVFYGSPTATQPAPAPPQPPRFTQARSPAAQPTQAFVSPAPQPPPPPPRPARAAFVPPPPPPRSALAEADDEPSARSPRRNENCEPPPIPRYEISPELLASVKLKPPASRQPADRPGKIRKPHGDSVGRANRWPTVVV